MFTKVLLNIHPKHELAPALDFLRIPQIRKLLSSRVFQRQHEVALKIQS